jgi:hypothetical protein
VTQAFLYYKPEGKDVRVEPVEISPAGVIHHRVDLTVTRLRPFARVYYWFQINAGDAPAYTSPSFWFDYIDDRFRWQSLENPAFRVFWVEGDREFGNQALNIAEDGVAAIQGMIAVPLPQEPIDIYIYPSAGDLKGALEMSGQTLVAGHANPDLGVVLLAIAPGPEQRLDLQQRMPHELAHVLLYLRMGAGYERLPAWYAEGFASLAELFPNPDYARALDQAKKNNALLPMDSLCQAFPRENSGAFLAYAQSASFMRSLNAAYGSTGLDRLAQAYGDGMGCQEGFSAALGEPLSQAEQAWREGALEIDTGQLALRNLGPYLALLGLLLIAGALPLVILLRRRAPQPAREG